MIPYSLREMKEKKVAASEDTPTLEPAVTPPVSQSEINRVMRELAARGGRTVTQRKLDALARTRKKRWEGHIKATTTERC